MRRALILPLLVLLSASSPAAAGDRRDHERARAALAAGEVRPLAELLAEVERRYVGRVIETELERHDGAWVYEFELLPPSGLVFEIVLDARTGALVRSRGPVVERR
ncbi:MAG: PepSY domain-containing protein [Alphaproteobacteria bacterium]|nr:PepSY domain-containing protein [Alphaproteobacteria bacterium]